jgi:hypothetical protein
MKSRGIFIFQTHEFRFKGQETGSYSVMSLQVPEYRRPELQQQESSGSSNCSLEVRQEI